MEHLLHPVSDDSPGGEYLKGNRSLYRGLRNSFNMAQSSFRQLMESPDAMSNEELLDANSNNWSELSKQSEETLQNTSKDTEVFCWLATAQLFSPEPLNNLAAVLEAFAESVELFWNDLNPKPPVEKLKASDERGQQQEWAEHRVKPVLQLIGDTQDSGLLYMPLQLTALIGDIDYSRYFSAERAGELATLKEEALAVFNSKKAQVTDTVLALGRCQDALELLESRINAHCQQDGAAGLSFRFVKDSIERLLNAIRYLVGEQLQPWPLDKIEEPPADVAQPEATSVSDSADSTVSAEASVASTPAWTEQSQATGQAVFTPGEIVNRDQAFQELRKIADFMQKTEPHSPVYMLLERAIRWGYMSLPELLNEMVGDNAQVMGRITQLAGLETTEKTSIPDIPVSAMQPAPTASVALTSPAISQPAVTAQPVAAQVNMPEEPQEPAAVSQAEQTNSDSGKTSSGISDFEW